MAVRLDTIGHLCDSVARQVRERFRNLTIHFIVHHQGQRVEALGMAGQDILYHPAAETAMHLLTKTRHADESSLVGMAVARQKLFFGLASRNSFLALCSINSDQYQNLKDARRHAYHLSWHAIDTLLYHNNLPSYASEVQDVVIRRRNTLEIAAANLEADVFAAMMSSFQGDREAVQAIAKKRGNDVVSLTTSLKPEHYPFILADGTTLQAMKRLDRLPLQGKRKLDTALTLARQIGHTFTEEDLNNWLAFAEPAQELAWRGTSRQEILSAAINTSENTHVRATGYHVAEALGLKPASVLDIGNSYSPYADDSFNQKVHEKAVDDIFEDIIARGLKCNSADAFTEMAHEQNIRLLEGHVVGWCASALQASGRSFSKALAEGKEPGEITRRAFISECDRTPWEALKELGEKIIGKQRNGIIMQLDALEEMTREARKLSRLNQSVKATLSDPQYQREYGIAPDGHRVERKPAPEIAAKLSQHVRPTGPAGPAPGGSMGGAVKPKNQITSQQQADQSDQAQSAETTE